MKFTALHFILFLLLNRKNLNVLDFKISGFVNAVLRNLIRNPIELPKGKDIYSLSVRFSCPEWIIDSYKADYGIENTEKLLEAGKLDKTLVKALTNIVKIALKVIVVISCITGS